MDGLDDDWCPDAYGDGAAHLGPALPSPRGVQAAPPVSDNLASVGWRVLGLIRGLFPFPFGPEPSLYAAPRASRGKPWRWAALLRSQWAALERAALADLCYSTMHFRVVRHVVAALSSGPSAIHTPVCTAPLQADTSGKAKQRLSVYQYAIQTKVSWCSSRERAENPGVHRGSIKKRKKRWPYHWTKQDKSG